MRSFSPNAAMLMLCWICVYILLRWVFRAVLPEPIELISLVNTGVFYVFAAHVVFALASVSLVVIDLSTHRLPNRLVLPLTIGLSTLLCIAAAVGISRENVERAFLAGVIMGALFLTIGMCVHGALGGGDVKLAVPIGMMLGVHSWSHLLNGFVFISVISTGIIAMSRLITRDSAAQEVPFGPWMLGSAWWAILSGSPLLRN